MKVMATEEGNVGLRIEQIFFWPVRNETMDYSAKSMKEPMLFYFTFCKLKI